MRAHLRRRVYRTDVVSYRSKRRYAAKLPFARRAPRCLSERFLHVSCTGLGARVRRCPDAQRHREPRHRHQSAGRSSQGASCVPLLGACSCTQRVAVLAQTLFVGRLSYDVSESKLRREFEAYGPVKALRIVHDAVTDKPRGYAFVEFQTGRDAKTAFRAADAKKLEGRRVVVDVERGRTVPGWLPRRLEGGLGGTRVGGKTANVVVSGRDARAHAPSAADEPPRTERDRERAPRGDTRPGADRERPRERSRDRDRSPERRRRSRSRDRSRGAFATPARQPSAMLTAPMVRLQTGNGGTAAGAGTALLLTPLCTALTLLLCL